MPRLIWSPAALNDMHQLYRFVAEHNVEAAKRAVAAIRRGISVLRQQAHIGRPVEHMDPAFREWLINFGGSGYVVLYRNEPDLVVIVAVRHQKQVGY